jgi:hypothetical protein
VMVIGIRILSSIRDFEPGPVWSNEVMMWWERKINMLLLNSGKQSTNT